jgi:hypothetical protein
MVPYSRRIRAITGVRSGDFRLSAHARPAGSPSLRQSRKLYAELISSDRQRKGTSRLCVFARRQAAMPKFFGRGYPLSSYDVETFCSASTIFRTVGRFSMRSCHAV